MAVGKMASNLASVPPLTVICANSRITGIPRIERQPGMPRGAHPRGMKALVGRAAALEAVGHELLVGIPGGGLGLGLRIAGLHLFLLAVALGGIRGWMRGQAV